MGSTASIAVASTVLGLGAATAVTATTASAAVAKSSTTTTTTSTTVVVTPADKWLIEAIGAMSKVGSVHINGKITQGKSTITLHLVVNGDGEGGGSFVQGGHKIQLKRVGPLLYFNAPKKFWATHATAAQTKAYGGKWIEVSALDSRFQSFDQFLNASDLVTAVFQGHTKPLTLSKPTTYQGHKVVIVKDSESGNGHKSTGLMYIAAKGQPYVYKIVDNTPGEIGTLTFTHYGKAVSISVPPEAINLT